MDVKDLEIQELKRKLNKAIKEMRDMAVYSGNCYGCKFIDNDTTKAPCDVCRQYDDYHPYWEWRG